MLASPAMLSLCYISYQGLLPASASISKELTKIRDPLDTKKKHLSQSLSIPSQIDINQQKQTKHRQRSQQ